jgi:MYXO-CTERM domain-containing protein
VIDDGEECDDGDDNSDRSAGACRTSCVAAFCGDGVIDDGETCDPATGEGTAADACTTGCTPPDAGVGPDAGITPEPDGDGCGCSAPGASNGASTGGLALLGLAVAVVFVRRSRRR